jgi:hypothetical protein
MRRFNAWFGRLVLAATVLASTSVSQAAGVAHADSGFGYTNPGLHLVAGADSGTPILGITNYLPSINVAGAHNPTVDWGDGTVDTLTFSTAPYTTTPCVFIDNFDIFCKLLDHHTYAAPGTFTITLRYQTGALVSYSTSTTATVIAATNVLPTPSTFAANGGSLFGGTIATFTDSNTVDPASRFKVAIDWGDGTPVDNTGTVTGALAFFSVQGHHTYTAGGNYSVDVKVSYGSQVVDVFSTARVSPPPPSILVNDTDPSITYSGSSWRYSAGRAVDDVNQDVHYATQDGDSVSYTFTGTGISYISERSEGYGTVNVYLDDAFEQTIDANAPGVFNQTRQVLFTKSGLSAGRHTIRLLKASGVYQLLDAFQVQTGVQAINDTDSALVYSGSGWFESTGRPATFNDLNNDVHATSNNGDAVSYTFTGTGISYVSEQSDGYGQVDVYLDGVLQDTIDANVPNVHNAGGQVLYGITDLAAGQHTLKLVKKSGAYMLLDALTVQH